MLFKARLDAVRRVPIAAEEIDVVGRARPAPRWTAAGARTRRRAWSDAGRPGDPRAVRRPRARPRGSPAADALPTTLRDAVGESYRLLDPPGQEVLRRLASFRHRWSLEMAEPLLADIVATRSPSSTGLSISVWCRSSARLDAVPAARRGARFRRRAARRGRRRACGGPRARPDHRRARCSGSRRTWSVPNFLAAVHRLDDIASDIRAALEYASEHEPATALSLAAALPRWWRFRGRDREGREIMRRLLDAPETAEADPTERAWAQLGVSLLAGEHGEALVELASTSVALATFADWTTSAANSPRIRNWSRSITPTGAYDSAREHGEAAFALATRTGRRRDVLVASTNLTWHDIRTGDLVAARRRLTALRKLAGELGEDRLASLALANLAEVERLDGRFADADHGRPGGRRLSSSTVIRDTGGACSGRWRWRWPSRARTEEATELLGALRAATADAAGADGCDRDGRGVPRAARRRPGRGGVVVRRGAADAGRPAGRAGRGRGPGRAGGDGRRRRRRQPARAELNAVCEASAVTLLPRDRALMRPLNSDASMRAGERRPGRSCPSCDRAGCPLERSRQPPLLVAALGPPPVTNLPSGMCRFAPRVRYAGSRVGNSCR